MIDLLLYISIKGGNMRPNLFSIATKELSQDAFITWLLQWADDSCLNENKELCNIGKEFIKKLISLKFSSEKLVIKKVNAGRQWENIDIWAEINDEYVIIIEDKVNTAEHDNQLELYKKTVEDYYGKNIKILFVYLKTGLECLDDIQKVKDKGWEYFSRKDFIEFLQNKKNKNEIYADFVSNLAEIQKESESFTEFEKLNSWEATKGLYSYIESKFEDDWTHWDYVSNPNGGFLGMWFHFTPLSSEKNCELYLQIENSCYNKINLFIKICGKWDRTIDDLHGILAFILKDAKNINLDISKPKKYRIGKYTSVAIVNDVFIKTENGKLDLENMLDKINKAILLIDNVTAKM